MSDMWSKRTLQNILLVTLSEGILALVWLLLIPKDPKNVRLLGFSPSRLLLIAGVLVGIGLLTWLVRKAFRDQGWLESQRARLNARLMNYSVLAIVNLISLLIALAGVTVLIITFITTDQFLRGVLLRLAPVIAWSSLVSLKIWLYCWSVDKEFWKSYEAGQRMLHPVPWSQQRFVKKGFWKSYEARVFVLFILSLAIYLSIAKLVFAPQGYYGTIEKPRFADPWIERTETILSGKLLYRDVFTTTPPLTNFLMIPPSLVARFFEYRNPWSTVSFMLYFSFFNLMTAYTLLYMGETRSAGWRAAAAFLLNPLTFGNAVLRRQDEAILVFFFGLFLLLLLKRRNILAAVSIGAALLVKLWGALLIPITFLHTRDWRFIILPLLVFGIVFGPFLFSAGQEAVFWDLNRSDTEHPFQYGGVSLGNLWSILQGHEDENLLITLSWIFLVGVGLLSILVVWKRFGVLQDLSILLAGILLLTPKLHTGYFSMLVLTLAPLLRSYRLTVPYFLIAITVLVADFFKFPIRNYPLSIALISFASILLILVILRLVRMQKETELDNG